MGRSSTMSNYMITLTPVDKFFFGGDMTFQVGDDKIFNEQFKSYIIQSFLFPQQTSLLGMMRFLILRNAGEDVFKNNQIVDKVKAKRLIGAQSFSVNENHVENNFGTIKSMSHVRIRRVGDGSCVDLEFKPLFRLNLDLSTAGTGAHNCIDVCLPDISKDEYDAKKGLESSLTDGNNEYSLDKVFKEDRRIGISRCIKTGKTGDDALFKQISYRFADDARYCFVFDAEIDDSIPLNQYNGQMVSIGGDNSQFVIGISKENPDVQKETMNNAICLMSPTYLTREEAKTVAFAITKLMPFRFLKSKMDEVNSYHILSRNLKRSEKFELYAPGSVFYFKNGDDKRNFAALIESKKEFRQIGYNEYK